MKKLKLEELGRLGLSEFKVSPKIPVVLVLDNIRSALNIGSAFRTADAFAIEKIVLCGICAQPPHKEINKTAIGATMSVDWEYFDSTREAIQVLKEQGYAIIGVEQTDQSISLDDWNPKKLPLALVLGNEVNGVSDEVIPMLDKALEINQFGTKHSLNVSVCIGICLWKCSRHFRS